MQQIQQGLTKKCTHALTISWLKNNMSDSFYGFVLPELAKIQSHFLMLAMATCY